jgi:hypothetical protein
MGDGVEMGKKMLKKYRRKELRGREFRGWGFVFVDKRHAQHSFSINDRSLRKRKNWKK